MTKKYILTIFLILFVSFAWGYKGESIVNYFKSSKPQETTNAELNNPPLQNTATQENENQGTTNNLGKTLESISPGQIPYERVDRANKIYVDSAKKIEEFQGGAQNIPPPANNIPASEPPAVDLSNTNHHDVYRSLSAGANPGFQQNTPTEPNDEDDDLEEPDDGVADDEQTDETTDDSSDSSDNSEDSPQPTDLP